MDNSHSVNTDVEYLLTEENYEKARLAASRGSDQPMNKKLDFKQKQLMHKVEYQQPQNKMIEVQVSYTAKQLHGQQKMQGYFSNTHGTVRDVPRISQLSDYDLQQPSQ